MYVEVVLCKMVSRSVGRDWEVVEKMKRVKYMSRRSGSSIRRTP